MTGVGNSVFSSSRAKRLEERMRAADRASAVRFRAPSGATVALGVGVAADALLRLLGGEPLRLPQQALAVMALLDPEVATCDLERVLILAARGEYPPQPEEPR